MKDLNYYLEKARKQYIHYDKKKEEKELNTPDKKGKSKIRKQTNITGAKTKKYKVDPKRRKRDEGVDKGGW